MNSVYYPRKKKKITKVFLISSVFILLFIPRLSSFYEKKEFNNKKTQAFKILEEKITAELQSLDTDASIFIKDLNHPEFKINFNAQKKIPAASIIKIPIAAVIFKAISEGKLSLYQNINIYRKDIAGGSGTIKSEINLPVTYTLEKLLEIMLTYSDNTATNKIISLLGFDYFNKSFQELHLKHTSLNRKMMDFYSRKRGIENYTSCADISLLLEQIYRGELIDKQTSAILLSFLKKQTVHDRLTRYTPKGIKIAHKTGLEKGVIHDGGIAFSPKGDYIICVLTENAQSHIKTKKFIAKLSLLTYNFYQ